MYLQQLYKHSKWLFALVALFIVGQLVVNFKRGMVVSPFFHYGMYSEVFKPAPTYEVFEVSVNGKQLRGSNYAPWTWDKIIVPLTYYSSINRSNQMFTGDIQRLMSKLRLPANEKHFLLTCDYPAFEAWYRLYLAKIINQPVSSINIISRTYQLQNGRLQPTAKFQLLSELCR